ncbi:PGL/p-HBAD biosynthesis glycosyltransferase [soil metagenome]
MERKKILFVSEDITLAQVVRLVQLAKSLDISKYEIHFACSDFRDFVFSGTSFIRWKLDNIEQEQVQKALDESKPIYSEEILEEYLQEELKLHEKVKPDIIVGDFRLSLAISAPLSNIPLIVLINAYWSPFTTSKEIPIPDHPMVNLLGENLAQFFFNMAKPAAFSLFAKPVNTIRKKNGLKSIGTLEETLTYGNFTLYPDIPHLIPTNSLPSSHLFLGPVIWSPEGELDLDPEKVNERPVIYITLGSSGKADLLTRIIRVISGLPVFALVATAGRVNVDNIPENVYLSKYLPDSKAAAASDLVVCNGGSTTGYQALNEGVPVLGIASNIDQYLAMNYIEKAGAGLLIRAGMFKEDLFEQKINQILEDPSFKRSALKLQKNFSSYDYKELFNKVIEKAITEKEVEIKQ